MENESFECAWGDRLFHGPAPVWHETRLVHSVSHRRNSFDFEFSRSFSTWRFTVRVHIRKIHLTNDKVFWNESSTCVKWILCMLFGHFDFTCCYDKVNFGQEIYIFTNFLGRNRILLMGRECWVCIWASFILVLSHLRPHKSFILLYSLDFTFHSQSASH